MGLPRPDPAKPRKRGYRAPARGVDVKPPLERGPGFGPNWPKVPKMAKKAIFSGFCPFSGKMGFLGVFGPPGPSPGPRFRGGFTSTPRAGALSPGRGPVPTGTGYPPKGEQGVPPWGVAAGQARRTRVCAALRPSLVRRLEHLPRDPVFLPKSRNTAPLLFQGIARAQAPYHYSPGFTYSKACGLIAPVTPTGRRLLYGAGYPVPFGDLRPPGPGRGQGPAARG